jgi:hypothetical protein
MINLSDLWKKVMIQKFFKIRFFIETTPGLVRGSLGSSRIRLSKLHVLLAFLFLKSRRGLSYFYPFICATRGRLRAERVRDSFQQHQPALLTTTTTTPRPPPTTPRPPPPPVAQQQDFANYTDGDPLYVYDYYEYDVEPNAPASQQPQPTPAPPAPSRGREPKVQEQQHQTVHR